MRNSTTVAAIRARYLIGADGMHSTVREHAGIAFAGSTYDESFVLADVRLDGGAPRDEVTLYFSPAGLVVVAPLPDGMHRVVATVDEAPEQPDLAFVQALLAERGPSACAGRRPRGALGLALPRASPRGRSYHAGRVVLAGDAAHVHSPAGGQGMNTGIQDAMALADALCAALDGAGEAALAAYAAQRRPVAMQVLAIAGRLTRLATVSRWLRPLRNALLRTLAHSSAWRRQLAWRLSGLAYR